MLKLDQYINRASSVNTSFCEDVVIIAQVRNPYKIESPGKTVDIFESKFEKRMYNKRRYSEGQWVFGGFERESGRGKTGKCIIDSNRLLSIIQEWIEPIKSDYWNAYDCQDSEGYQHLKVNHSMNFVDPSQLELIQTQLGTPKALTVNNGRKKNISQEI